MGGRVPFGSCGIHGRPGTDRGGLAFGGQGGGGVKVAGGALEAPESKRAVGITDKKIYFFSITATAIS